jgi:hypothetical protein
MYLVHLSICVYLSVDIFNSAVMESVEADKSHVNNSQHTKILLVVLPTFAHSRLPRRAHIDPPHEHRVKTPQTQATT